MSIKQVKQIVVTGLKLVGFVAVIAVAQAFSARRVKAMTDTLLPPYATEVDERESQRAKEMVGSSSPSGDETGQVLSKQSLAEKEAAIEKEFDRSGPIYAAHLGPSQSSGEMRISHEPVRFIEPLRLSGATSLEPRDIEVEASLVDIFSPQRTEVAIEKTADFQASSGSQQYGICGTTLGQDIRKRPIPPRHVPPAPALPSGSGGTISGGFGQGPSGGRIPTSQAIGISRADTQRVLKSQVSDPLPRRSCCQRLFASKEERRSYNLTDAKIQPIVEAQQPRLEVQAQKVVRKWNNIQEVKRIIQTAECPAFSQQTEVHVRQAYKELNQKYPLTTGSDLRILYNSTLTNGEYITKRGQVRDALVPSGRNGSEVRYDNRAGGQKNQTWVFDNDEGYSRPRFRAHIVIDEAHRLRGKVVGNTELGDHGELYCQSNEYLGIIDLDTGRRVPTSKYKPGRFLKSC